jgi:DHA1 family bicyclomycin/chloramphenicol resistance-like MFS transporter
VGVAAAATAALGLLAVAVPGLSLVSGLAVPWLLLAVVTGSMGLILPATTTLAQQAGDRARGTVSALQGGPGQLAGALATPLTGVFCYSSLLPMAVLMTAGFGAAALTLVAVARSVPDRRPVAWLPRDTTARPSNRITSHQVAGR